MKHLLIILCLCACQASSAELLIAAQQAPMLSIDTIGKDSVWMAEYDMQLRRGQVVVIKPDGWTWGKKEGPPKFVRVKILGMPRDSLLRFLDPEARAITSDTGKVIQIDHARRWMLPKSFIDSLVITNELGAYPTVTKVSLTERLTRLSLEAGP